MKIQKRNLKLKELKQSPSNLDKKSESSKSQHNPKNLNLSNNINKILPIY